MAKLENHLSLSTGTGVLYAIFGAFFLDLGGEVVFLASVLLIMAGLLPNMDEAGDKSGQELMGLFAALAPLVIIQFYPSLQSGKITTLALIIILSYLITKYFLNSLFSNYTSHRGALHSIPASIITFEIVFLIFNDLPMLERVYLAGAAFVGFFSHLLIDAYTNLDLYNRATGKGVPQRPAVMKLWTNNINSTLGLYTTMIILGYFVARDISPNFKLFAGVQY